MSACFRISTPTSRFSQKRLRCLGSGLTSFAARGGRQKSRTKAGRKEGRKEKGKEGRQEGRKGRKEGREGRKEGTSADGVESVDIVWK